jgi:hypothetical protein
MNNPGQNGYSCTIVVIAGAQFKPLIMDNFIMLTAGPQFEQGKTCEVVFQAQRISSPD